jgi:hypothetical protein
MKSPLELKHPDLHELIMRANEFADKAQAAETEYEQNMREAMKVLRERLGVSADIFGGLCGVSGPYISMLESGQRPWNSKLMTKMNHKLALL